MIDSGTRIMQRHSVGRRPQAVCSQGAEGSPGAPVRLRFRLLEFTFRAREAVRLPPFAGSACRGAFGHALREAVCTQEPRLCGRCAIRTDCPYIRIFESPRGVCPAPPWFNDAALPHPFVLKLPAGETRVFRPGEPLRLQAVLVGWAAAEGVIPFVAGMAGVGATGLGEGLGRLDLAAVADRGGRVPVPVWADGVWAGAPLPPPLEWRDDLPVSPQADRLEIEWVTPLRLANDGRTLRDADFGRFVGSLLRRIAILAACHGDGPPDWDWHAVWRAAGCVRTESQELRFVSERRWSQRQRRHLPMDGVVGRMTVSGPLAPLLPYLAAGQLLHAGKATAFGCGEYRLRPELAWRDQPGDRQTPGGPVTGSAFATV